MLMLDYLNFDITLTHCKYIYVKYNNMLQLYVLLPLNVDKYCYFLSFLFFFLFKYILCDI